MTVTISALPVTETNETASAPEPSPLEQLIIRAQASAESATTNKRNKALLKEMAVVLVALARMNADLIRQVADKPRIVGP